MYDSQELASSTHTLTSSVQLNVSFFPFAEKTTVDK